MQHIFYFIYKNSSKILFMLLLIASLILTINGHYFHKTLFLSSTNEIAGVIYNKKHQITEYINLKEDNDILAKENSRLKQLLFNTSNELDSITMDNLQNNVPINFKVFLSKIIHNSYLKRKNYMTINNGENIGIKKDMGVVSNKGVIGIIEKTSNKYATIQSILNTNTKITGKIKKTDHFGTIVWDTKSPYFVQLTDIPKLAHIEKGDTIVTGGISTIFPKNIPIGIIDEVSQSETSNFYNINVKLFNDMTNINHVFIIENLDIEEIKELESHTIDE